MDESLDECFDVVKVTPLAQGFIYILARSLELDGALMDEEARSWPRKRTLCCSHGHDRQSLDGGVAAA